VITREQAEAIASRIVHTEPGGWELEEFNDGWLIREHAGTGTRSRGAAMRVVERATGRVMRFPSSIPSNRILNEYDAVVSRGRAETPGA
jgi:hypothetical protein